MTIDRTKVKIAHALAGQLCPRSALRKHRGIFHSSIPTSLPSSWRTKFASVRPSLLARASRAFRRTGLTQACTSLCALRCFLARASALRAFVAGIRMGVA